MRVLAFILAFLISATAHAQQVQQSGTATQGHAAAFVTNGVIRDAGTAANGNLTSLGVTASGSGICQNSAAISSPGWQQICLGATTAGGGYFSVQNFGTATPQGFTILINGVPFVFPNGITGTIVTADPPTTVGSISCFATTDGHIAPCTTITNGVWQATPIDIPYGGTGATTAAGARTALGLGTMAQQDSNSVNITGATQITGLPVPVASADAATKGYVDATATGLNIQTPVVLATAAVLPNTPTYSNGASGVGATLTAGGNAALTVDSTAASLNQRILVKNQASTTGCTVANVGCQNGVYTVTTVGDGSTPWVLTRATDFDTSAEMLAGSYFLTTSGSANGGSSFVLQSAVTTVGTTPAVFVQFSSTVAGVTSFNTRTGSVTLNAADVIAAGQLEVLTTDRTYFVRTDGNNNCNGLTNAAGSSGNCAFLTIQKGVDTAFNTLNWAGHNVTISVRAGTYTTPTTIVGNAIGQTQTSTFSIVGDVVTPSNVLVSTTGADAFNNSDGGVVTISGIKTQTATSGNCYTNTNGGILTIVAPAFGASAGYHVQTVYQGFTNITSQTYTISGGAVSHYFTALNATLLSINNTITLTGTPNFSIAFLTGAVNSYSHLVGTTFSGAATGLRFYMYMNAVYSDGSANGYNYLPGNAAGNGITQSGAVYNNDYEYNSWGTYTPVVSVGAGTGGTAFGQYKSHGKDLHLNVQLTISSSGSASAAGISLPTNNNYYNLAAITPIAYARALSCVDSTSPIASGLCAASIAAGSSQIIVAPAGGSFTAGHIYVITGTMEMQ